MVDYAREDPGVNSPHTFGLGPAAAPAVLGEFGIGTFGPRKVRNPIVPEMPTETMTIVSVFPRVAFNKVFMFGQYEMPACPPCDKHGRAPCERCGTYAKLVVGAAREAIDDPFGTDGSGRRLNVINAGAVARSLLTDGCLDRGVFVCEGAEPTQDELRQALVLFRSWAENAVNKADEQWGQKRDAALIDPLARDAAKFLGHKRDWISETADMVDCEACGERARKGALVCKCGNPFNWQAAHDRGLLSERQESYARKNSLIKEEQEEEVVVEAAPQEASIPVEQGKRPGKRHVYGS